MTVFPRGGSRPSAFFPVFWRCSAAAAIVSAGLMLQVASDRRGRRRWSGGRFFALGADLEGRDAAFAWKHRPDRSARARSNALIIPLTQSSSERRRDIAAQCSRTRHDESGHNDLTLLIKDDHSTPGWRAHSRASGAFGWRRIVLGTALRCQCARGRSRSTRRRQTHHRLFDGCPGARRTSTFCRS